MTDRDVSSGDMPNFPWPSRRDAPEIGDAPLEALLAGTELPADAPSRLQPLSEVLAALKARPASDELAGEAAALAAFQERARYADPGTPITPWRPRCFAPLPARAAAAATIAALSFGALATAAFAGALPAPPQHFATPSARRPRAPPDHRHPSRGPHARPAPPVRRPSGCAPPGRTPKRRAPPPACGGFPQACRRGRWREQGRRLLRRRAEPRPSLLPQLPPDRAPGLPPHRPPGLPPHRPPGLPPHAARHGQAILPPVTPDSPAVPPASADHGQPAVRRPGRRTPQTASTGSSGRGRARRPAENTIGACGDGHGSWAACLVVANHDHHAVAVLVRPSAQHVTIYCWSATRGG